MSPAFASEPEVNSLAAVLAQLKPFIEDLPVAVYVCEAPSGVIRLYNRHAAELWGREPRVGDPAERYCGAAALSWPDGRPLAPAETPMAEVLREGTVRDGEVVITRPGGRQIPVRVRIAPLRDDAGQVIGAINTFQAVSVRPEGHGQPTDGEEARARLAALVASADDAIVSKTLDGVITSWNRGAERMFGYTAGEAVGQSIVLIIPPERLHEEADILARLKRGEAIEHLETERVSKDGRRIPVSLTVSPIRDARGRVIGASKIARDITERHRADVALRANVQTLEVLYRLTDAISRARTRQDVCEAAIDAVLAGARAARASVLVFDATDRMRFVCWRGLSDDYRAAVEGHSPWSRDTRDAAPILVENVATEPALAGLRDVILGEGIRAVAFVPLVYHGRLLGKFMIYHDAVHRFSEDEVRLATTIAHHVAFGLVRAEADEAIAELFRREQAARAEAETANRAKDEFLAVLSHELRTPLNAITGWVRMLRTGTLAPDTVGQALEAIDRNAVAQAQLIEDILDVSRIVSGKLRLDVRTTRLAPILAAALDAVRPAAERKGVQLELNVAPGVDRVVADAGRLQQVVWNLLSNAVKFTPAGGVVTVTAAADADSIEIAVSDTGIGIDAEMLPHVFERFRQADSSSTRQHGGLGLGLALARNLVELHGGTIEAASAGRDKGATFVVRLPRMATAVTTADQEQRPGRRAADGRAPLQGVTVLVVDDESDARDLCSAVLAVHGAIVETAAAATAALERIEAARPDVVLADLSMPGEDGFSLLRRLRALESDRGRRTPVIALTAYASVEDRLRVLAAGFDAHVPKPFEPDALVALIGELLPPP